MRQCGCCVAGQKIIKSRPWREISVIIILLYSIEIATNNSISSTSHQRQRNDIALVRSGRGVEASGSVSLPVSRQRAVV